MSFEINPLTGRADGIGVPQTKQAGAPTGSDYRFPVGQQWVDTTGGAVYFLASISGTTATWEVVGSGTGTPVTQIDGDSGSATGGTITLATGSGASTSATGSTVTFSLDAGLVDVAGLTPTDSNFIVGDGANWIAESGATARTSLGLGSAAVESDNKYCSRADNLANLANAATARTNLGLGTIATQDANSVSISGGSVTGITDLVVADGGSGRGTATAYGVICGGTTATGAHQSVASVGTAAQVLTSNGAGALPTFQDAGGGGGGITATYGILGTSGTTILDHILSTGPSGGDTTTVVSPANAWCYSVNIAEDITVTDIGLWITSGSGNIRFALYEADSGDFGTRIFESGVVSLASTGIKYVSSAQTISAGGYWLVIVSDGAAITFDAHSDGGRALLAGVSNYSMPVSFSYTYGELVSNLSFSGRTITGQVDQVPVLLFQ